MNDPEVTVTTQAADARSVASLGHVAGGGAEQELLSAGAVVGRYVVDAHIGAGGMGRVYAAHDPQLDRKVALKLLRAERDDADGRDRLLREARALAKLAHPHVVAVHDVGTVGDRVFVAMEHVSGTTLAKFFARRRPGWREVLDLLLPVGRGLAAVHAAGLVHRDLKPDNIMIGDDGRVRLMDFGLARAPAPCVVDDEPAGRGAERAGRGAERALDDTTLTHTGVVLGTPPYMAAEQWRGLAADARTDQFAFCVTLWEALYGERPFAGRVITELERAIAGGIISTPPRAVDVPRWLHRALVRGLAVEPGDRHPSMDTLIELLERGRQRGRARFIVAVLGLVATVSVGFAVASTMDRAAHGPVAEDDEVVAVPPDDRVGLAQCEANEVCVGRPLSVPTCMGADGEATSEGRPCTPGSDDACPERESCVTVGRSGGETGKCTPVCQIQDDRPACAPGCYNQQCLGNFDLCAREHGTCSPVPCATDDDCTQVATCDYPLRDRLGFRCNVEVGFCARSRPSL